jgi:hypothetical protein
MWLRRCAAAMSSSQLAASWHSKHREQLRDCCWRQQSCWFDSGRFTKTESCHWFLNPASAHTDCQAGGSSSKALGPLAWNSRWVHAGGCRPLPAFSKKHGLMMPVVALLMHTLQGTNSPCDTLSQSNTQACDVWSPCGIQLDTVTPGVMHH